MNRIGFVWPDAVKVGDGRMVGALFAECFCAIIESALESLSKDRVERFFGKACFMKT